MFWVCFVILDETTATITSSSAIYEGCDDKKHLELYGLYNVVTDGR